MVVHFFLLLFFGCFVCRLIMEESLMMNPDDLHLAPKLPPVDPYMTPDDTQLTPM